MNTSPTRTTPSDTTPSDTKDWYDEFIVELRLREVRGTAIGDAVSQVEGHCAESGESPAEAFGKPREYARSLEFGDEQLDHTSSADVARLVLPAAAGTLGLVLAGQAAMAYTRLQDATLTWGVLSCVALVAILGMVAARILPALLHRRLNFVLFFGGGVTLATGLAIGWRTRAVTLPWVPMAVAAAILLAASVILMRRNRPAIEDTVVDPVTGAEHQATSSRVSSRAMTRALEWMFVVVAVLDVILCLAIEHFA